MGRDIGEGATVDVEEGSEVVQSCLGDVFG